MQKRESQNRPYLPLLPGLFRVALILIIATTSPLVVFTQATGGRPTLADRAGTQVTGPATTLAIEKGMNEFGLWGGSSLDSPALIGGAKGRKLPLLIALRYGRVFAAGKRVAVEYTFDIVPAAVVSQPESDPTLSSPTANLTTNLQTTRRRYGYGAGVFPVGFKILLRRQSRVKPFAGISSGPLYFNRRVPRPDAARFNFLSNVNAGVQIFTDAGRAITIGYEIGHLSNAGISRVNPGFNMNFFFFGIAMFK